MLLLQDTYFLICPLIKELTLVEMSKVIGILYNVYLYAAFLHKSKLMYNEKFEVSFVFYT